MQIAQTQILRGRVATNSNTRSLLSASAKTNPQRANHKNGVANTVYGLEFDTVLNASNIPRERPD